jgi:hypothetical protein
MDRYKEDFMANVKELLKLRGGWGKLKSKRTS